jgi:c-di-GMP-binding flagellar brake protein YcgR
MEKRKERRFKQWNIAGIKSATGLKEFSDPEEINAYTYDLSLGGAKIHSDINFPVGTAVRMRLELVRTKESVSIDGVVRWASRSSDDKVFELGVEFSHLMPKSVFALMQDLYDRSAGLPTRLSERRVR